MTKRIFTLSLAMLLTAILSSMPAQCEENESVESLRRHLLEQDDVIQSLLDRLDTLEKNQAEGAYDLPSWLERISLKGDFRYRHEMIDPEGRDHRNRHRVRARIHLLGKVNDVVDVGVQIATGNFYDDGLAQDRVMGDAVSSNQTLDEGWSSKPIWLDMAYFDFHPFSNSEEAGWNLNILGGKFNTPFDVMQKTELLWDPDLRPEGIALMATRDCGGFTLFSNAGGFYIEEEGGGADTGMFGAQVGVTVPLNDNGCALTVGSGYYNYGNVKGKDFVFDDGAGFGNTADIGGNYAEDFDEVELFAECTFEAGDFPIAVFANAVSNIAADHGNHGALAGFKVGKTKKPGSWDVRYQYKRLEPDAVLAAFTDSDFGGGGTDVKGHEFNLGYMLATNWKVSVSYFINRTGFYGAGTSNDFRRFQFDFKFKF